MTASVRILSTSSVDSSPSILLIEPDGSKILIDCGEGCQRCFLEHSQKLQTLKAICLTHLSHSSFGGLPGLILTKADGGSNNTVEDSKDGAMFLKGADGRTIIPDVLLKRQITGVDATDGIELVGPNGTLAFIKSLDHFMKRSKFHVNVREGTVPSFQPRGFKQRTSYKKMTIDRFTPDLASFSIQSFDFSSVADESTAGRKRLRSNDRTQQTAMSYLFSTGPLAGKFLAQQAVELGVPKGPLLGRLKGGGSVSFLNADGIETTVESHQVVTPTTPGVGVLVLYYPTPDVAQLVLKSNDIIREAFRDDLTLELVIHLASDETWVNQMISWLNAVAVKVQPVTAFEHIFLSLNKDNDQDGTPFRSAGLGALSRSLINSEIYRIPTPAAPKIDDSTLHFIIARTMMEYTLIPRAKRGFMRRGLPPLDEEEARDAAESSGAIALAKQITGSVTSSLYGDQGNNGALVLTGTASAIPCKHRNVTGMALIGKNGRSFLLDVGEGTVGQLMRSHVQAGNYLKAVAEIRGVWISHPHADHHLGLWRLLHDRHDCEPLVLFAPEPVLNFLNEYAAVDPGVHKRFVGFDCKDLQHENIRARELLFDVFEFTDVRTIPVAHCPHSFAIILDGTAFGRLAYSGDCRPSRAFARAAKGADLLIHEATFEDGMESEAVLKRHSTIGEALSVALEMEAKCTILTHFSQRYPKTPPVPTNQQYSSCLIFAFDYMRLTPETLHIAAALTPSLRLLNPNDDAETTDEKAASAEKSNAILSIPGLFAHSNVL
jgi:ribonuclease Z